MAAQAAAEAAAEAVQDAQLNRDEALTGADESEIIRDPEVIERDEEDLLAALRELDTGSDIEWGVHKISGPPDERGFIEKLASQQLNLQYFRDKYGPGEYKVLGRRGGYYVKGGYKQIKISTVGYVKPSDRPQTDPTADILKVLDAKSKARNDELKSWAMLLVPVLGPALIEFIKPKNNVSELLAGMAALQKLTPEQPKPPSLMTQINDLIGAMGKIKELGGANEPAPTGSTWVDVLRDGIKDFAPVFGAMANRVGGRMPPLIPGTTSPATPLPMPSSEAPSGPSNPAPSTPSGAPAPDSSPNSGSPDPMALFLGWLRQTLEQLVVKAAANKNPQLYAEVMYDNVPEGIDPKSLVDFLKTDTWWAQLANFYPPATPYQGWFTQMRDALLEIASDTNNGQDNEDEAE
jgi:hypothetical protein